MLSDRCSEITARLDETVVEVRLSDGEPAFVVSTALPRDSGAPPGPEPAEGVEGTGTARVTLRLSESLKGAIETAAASDGVSVNTWLTRAASHALGNQSRGSQPGPRRGPGQRITGFARADRARRAAGRAGRFTPGGRAQGPRAAPEKGHLR